MVAREGKSDSVKVHDETPCLCDLQLYGPVLACYGLSSVLWPLLWVIQVSRFFFRAKVMSIPHIYTGISVHKRAALVLLSGATRIALQDSRMEQVRHGDAVHKDVGSTRSAV